MFGFDKEGIIKRIKYADVVSFDIFDTLIKRNVSRPTQLFDLVEHKYNSLFPDNQITGFKELRIEAERTARNSHPDLEVSLDEIYSYIDDNIDKKCLESLEIEEELHVCEPNALIVEVFNYCKEIKKKTVIVSDMYLPYEVIEKMLTRCGIEGYWKLYLSSQLGFQKKDGSLYDYVIKDLGISPKKIVHFGDRKKTDNLIPRKKGMNSVYVDPFLCNMAFSDRNVLKSSTGTVLPFINNQLPKYKNESDFFRWGYETFGPLLLGFCQWINSKAIEKNVRKMFFLARDMNLVFDIYGELYGDVGIETTYLEVSRRSLRVAYVIHKGGLEAVFDTMTRKQYTVEEVLLSLGLKWDEIKSEKAIVENNIGKDSAVSNISVRENWFEDLSEAILKVLRTKDDYADSYLKEKGVFEKGEKAIVDIGWHATIQNIIEELSGDSFVGFYFGNSKRHYFKEMDLYGYWYSFDEEKKALAYLAMVNILEAMLFAQVGTTIGYKQDGDKTKPIYNECEMNDFSLIGEFQKGALKFIKDYTGEFPDYWNVNREEAVLGYSSMAFAPSLRQAKAFADLPYEEGGIKHMALSQGWKYYLTHPKQLLGDYAQAKWKEGFIKQIMPFVKKPHKIDVMVKRINSSKRKYL